MSVIEGPWPKEKPKAKPWRPPALSALASQNWGDAFAREDRSHICPTLDGEFATRLEFAAALLKQLAGEAKSLKRMHEEITCSNAAEILEHRAANIRLEIGDHD